MTMTTAATPKRRPTLRDLMFRSTIYNRHEARRAKTLLRKGDPRPALLRILVPSGAAAAIAAKVEKKSTTTNSNSNNLNAAIAQHETQPYFADDSVFCMHDATDATHIQDASRPASTVGTTAMAATAGAVFSEAVFGARCLRQASPFHQATTRVWRMAAQAHPHVSLEHAALTVQQHTWQSVVPHLSNVSLFAGSSSSSVSNAQLASRAAPVALLFGTKAATEHLLQGGGSKHNTTNAPPPAVAISILSATVAGAVLGSLRSLWTVPTVAGWTVVGREMAGATLYFSLYDGVRHCLVRNNDNGDDKALYPVATATAGALAGVVYDSVRVYGQLPMAAATSTTATTRSLATIAVRAAPSHALLFLGYEVTRRLL